MELCCICFTSELREEACVRLSCGHVFHAECVYQLLSHGQNTLAITFGYLVSSFILSKLDCRIVNIIFLILNSLSMMAMGVSFMFPSLSSLSIPCLVFSGLCYGLGVGPVSFVLMSSLYPQKMKSAGVAVSQTCRALIVLIQLKVCSFQILSRSYLIFFILHNESSTFNLPS